MPWLDHGDVIVDGGNSHFEDTIRRTRELDDDLPIIAEKYEEVRVAYPEPGL